MQNNWYVEEGFLMIESYFNGVLVNVSAINVKGQDIKAVLEMEGCAE